ncbi:MAG: porin family protein [Myxococcales bacterium FL481]|nr:MAG: porin family protein [Myxococcales bacterium FL481]
MTTRFICTASLVGTLSAVAAPAVAWADSVVAESDVAGPRGMAAPVETVGPAKPVREAATPAPATGTDDSPPGSSPADVTPESPGAVPPAPAAPAAGGAGVPPSSSAPPSAAPPADATPPDSPGGDANEAVATAPGESDADANESGVMFGSSTPTPTRVAAPLPAPPPPVPVSALLSGPWRGVGWLAVHLTTTGPIGGDRPALPTVVAVGFGLEAGWRVNNFLGIGTGVSRQTHERSDYYYIDQFTSERILERSYGELTNFDVLFARGYLPVRGRVQPFAEIGGGLVILEPTDVTIAAYVGGQGRAGLGVEAWISRSLTLAAGARYRLTAFEDATGHSYQGYLQFGVHW